MFATIPDLGKEWRVAFALKPTDLSINEYQSLPNYHEDDDDYADNINRNSDDS